ncbi:hypothetical protein WICPIJ_000614 [Wickerhamomyces pijperi]|uniref:Protein HIR n=1 Tax=Wickerhamomyces pijperi TaxID=599730 RepID=A0A9P8TSB7_WICPI|nr:hypothetical protein WICPIJ_000614 [Wickerhamomyces pijperi]
MRAIKLPLSCHKSNITALDVLQNHLLTGTTSGKVFVWDIKKLNKTALLESPTYEDFNSLKPTSSCTAHQDGRITSVKFFDQQRCISSASDGKVIMTNIITGKVEVLLEHEVEINDIQIMENFVFAATLNKILIINALDKELVTSITVKSDVKCISLDPTKNYLTVIGFNKSCSMYQVQITDGDVFCKRMDVPLETVANVNGITRTSWTSIGDKYALPNTPTPDKNIANTVGIYRRKDFKLDFQLVGPDANIVKFSPRLYNMNGNLTNFIALACEDGSFSVWNSCYQTSLFEAAGITTSSISDVAWSEDGQTVFTSADTLMIFAFEESDLGQKAGAVEIAKLMRGLTYPEPLSTEEMKDQLSQRKSHKVSVKEMKPKPKKSQTAVNASPSTNIPAKKPTTQTPKLLDSPNITSNEKISTTKPKQPSNVKVAPKAPQKTETQIELQSAVVKDGKKRVAPTLISGIGNAQQPKPSQAAKQETTEPSRLMDFQQPSYSVPRDLKRREEFKDGPDSQVKKKRDLEVVEFIGSIVINPSTAFSKLRVSTPKIRSSFIQTSPTDDTIALEIVNGSGNTEKPSKVSLVRGSSRLIFDYIPKLIGLATGGGGKFWAVSTIDGVVYVFGNSGRKLLPVMTLGTPLSFLESKGPYLMAVTSIGEIYVWDVLKKKVHFSPTSLYSILSRSNPELLTRAENLTLVSLSSNGIPVVTISNGNGFIYDPDMEVWNVVSDTWWAFGSQFWDGGRATALHGNQQNIMTVLESKTNDEILRKGRGKFLQQISKTMLMKEGYENLEKVISLSHLENKILISAKLGNSDDFKALLLIYCKRVSEMGLRSKLLEVLQGLYNERKGSKEDEDIKNLGLDKKELLKDVIFNCANIRSVQRILVEYATLLGIVDQLIL